MIFYLSARPVCVDGKRLLTPDYMLENGFRGIPIKFRCIAPGAKDDGRWLYEIDTDTIESRDVIVEGLQMWGAHLKSTIEKTKELAEKLHPGRIYDIDLTSNKITRKPKLNTATGLMEN